MTPTIIDVAEILPQLSSGVEILKCWCQAGTNPSGGTVLKYMKCRREKVRAAILRLNKYSPPFESMEISLEKLELLPEYGFLTPTIVTIDEE